MEPANHFVPLCLKDQSWPDTIKKEFSGQMHRFMASLTETAWDQRGTTTLYIPAEELSNAEAAAKQKDLVQRLETTLIHWTRQIKEVVNHQDNSELGEDAGPLAEIEFWRARSIDLSGIRSQLDHEVGPAPRPRGSAAPRPVCTYAPAVNLRRSNAA